MAGYFIRSRFDNRLLYSGEFQSLKEAVEAAVSFGASLDRANLDRANLDRANLDRANLSGANLAGASLDRANLDRANLDRANLSGANLAGANLAGASLAEANLNGANLVRADFARANLGGANFARANLVRADFARANLGQANFVRASLDGSSLDGITGNISVSHELLAELAIQYDDSLRPVAAMIAGRRVGCWPRYTRAIREIFGGQVMRQLWRAWSRDASWGVVEKMRKYGWPEPEATTRAAEAGGE